MTISRDQLQDFYDLAKRFVEAVETVVERGGEKDRLRMKNKSNLKRIEKLESRLLDVIHKEKS